MSFIFKINHHGLDRLCEYSNRNYPFSKTQAQPILKVVLGRQVCWHVDVGTYPNQVLAATLTLFQWGRAYYAHNISTLISLINVESTLADFEKFHPPQNRNPPSTFIEFLDFSTLHVYSNLHVLLRWYIH